MLARMWRKGNPCTVGGTVNWYSHYGKQYGSSSKKLKIELPYDLVFPLLGTYPKVTKSISWRDICTPMSTAALLTRAKIWKQVMCPLTWVDEENVIYRKIYIYTHIYTHICIHTHTHTYTMEYCSAKIWRKSCHFL